MMVRFAIYLTLIFLANAGCAAPKASYAYRPSAVTPPPVPREFRGAWVTIVADHQDWPSAQNLTVDQQKAELVTLLDRAAQMHLNAIVFQVRPACDAVYASSIEPWSNYLNGFQGKAPQPFYDPLAFAIQEAHKRGIELHAWFNPFRAWHTLSKSPVAPNHISRTHPEWVRHYGDQLWLDPGDPAVRDYVVRVVMDVVKRYDIDGVQFDDYFYPYPEKDENGRAIDFPDYALWKRYGLPNNLDVPNWRRQNINKFVQSTYENIKTVKPWVKFGISPFGIWRPFNPAPIRGMDAYATLYADSRLWLGNGWVDYMAPQLYWAIDDQPHSFTALLNWWTQQNIDHRNIFAALSAAYVGEKFPANEIARQIAATRAQPGASGEIFFHFSDLINNPQLTQIVSTAYSQKALTPSYGWLRSSPPQKAKLAIDESGGVLNVHWGLDGGQVPWQWVLQTANTNNVWTTQILSGTQTNVVFQSPVPDTVSVRAVDRQGNLSAPVTLRKVIISPGGKGKAGYRS